jgi:hypothetical protein
METRIELLLTLGDRMVPVRLGFVFRSILFPLLSRPHR